MLLTSFAVITIAIGLLVLPCFVALSRPRPAMSLAIAAIGVGGFAIGLLIGQSLDRLDQAERAVQKPLTTEELEHNLIATLFPNGAIQTAVPDDRTVCHDWTFGGSRYSDGCPVATLLADYEPTVSPRPGDIVVYWGSNGDAVHSGIVRAVGAQGFVVIESKWGHMGRYLHLTGISHFPSRFSYYRRRISSGPPPEIAAVGDARRVDSGEGD
jgi:hypothetical protein